MVLSVHLVARLFAELAALRHPGDVDVAAQSDCAAPSLAPYLLTSLVTEIQHSFELLQSYQVKEQSQEHQVLRLATRKFEPLGILCRRWESLMQGGV